MREHSSDPVQCSGPPSGHCDSLVSKKYYLKRVGSERIAKQLKPGRGLARTGSSPRLAYQADPIRDSLKILGKKWVILVLRDVGFLNLSRFGEIKRNNPGLTARVLSRRLKEMTKQGLLKREENGDIVRYRLTGKGEDAIYILLALLRYGMRHHMGQKGQFNPDKAMKDLHYDSSLREATRY